MSQALILAYLVYFFASLFLPKKGLLVEFIDVGFGDSALVTTANGGKILIDGGGNYEALRYLGEKMPPGFCSLDVVILTHPHADHLFGLDRVLGYCDVKLVFSNAYDYDSDLYRAWVALLESSGIAVKNLYKGDVFYVDSIKFISFWPDKGYNNANINNFSQVLLMDAGDFEVLFTGDAEIDALLRIAVVDIQEYIEDGELEVVKIPHHGSKTAMLERFYTELNPKECIVSVDRENMFGLPSEEFLSFLENLGCDVKRTCLDGTVRVLYNLNK